MKDSFDMYIARTQARLAFFLLIVLVLLTCGVVAIMLFPQVKPPQEIVGLIVQVLTGVLALCGSAIAYFFARHRPPTVGDQDDPNKIVSKQTSTTEVSQSIPLVPATPANNQEQTK
jgi:hypothetical protein